MAVFWLRTKALLIDALGIALVYRALDLIGFSRTSLASQLAYTAALWTYFAAMESSPWAGTLGKHVIGLRVTDINGNQIGFGRALARNAGRVISTPLLVGYLMMLWSKRGQTLHDWLAGCLVTQLGSRIVEDSADRD